MELQAEKGLWIFGYGSLVWNPGFDYKRSRIGFIRGYDRRFWQGNDTHRGTPEKPGRVATLVENERGVTWGCAFELKESSASESLAYLERREGTLGGYVTSLVSFQPSDLREEPFLVLLYVATRTNPLYLGPAPLLQLAKEIGESRGSSGENAEYVVRLADFMREHVPHVWDDHLFTLERYLQLQLRKGGQKQQQSGAATTAPRLPQLKDGCRAGPHVARRQNMTSTDSSSEDDVLPRRSEAFQDHVPTRKLRCVDI